EWARYGIRVNALPPGYFATELNDDFFESEHGQALIKRVPQRRLGQLTELDGPLLLLISDAGSFMTGSASGALQQGLASIAGTMRHYQDLGVRWRRLLRPGRFQRQPRPRHEGDVRSGRTAYHSRAPPRR